MKHHIWLDNVFYKEAQTWINYTLPNNTRQHSWLYELHKAYLLNHTQDRFERYIYRRLGAIAWQFGGFSEDFRRFIINYSCLEQLEPPREARFKPKQGFKMRPYGGTVWSTGHQTKRERKWHKKQGRRYDIHEDEL